MKQAHADIFDMATADKLFRFAVTLLGGKEDAEDAVHDLLERLWRKREELRGTRNMEAFAFTSMRHLCIDRLRHRRDTTDDIPDMPSGETADRWSEVEKVRRAIARLPERQREVIHLRDIEGYSGADTAAITGIDEDAVRVYLSRARKAVRNFIEAEDSYRGDSRT